MKRLSVVKALVTVMLFSFTSVEAQKNELPISNVIPSLPLAINCSKTTNLVFPFQIKSVDRGSKDLLVQKANGVENVLQIKAAKEGFEETNLSVITGEGKLYSFTVSYAVQPLNLNLRFLKDSGDNKDTSWNLPETTNEAVMETDAQYISDLPRSVSGIKDKKYGMKIRTAGLFIKEDVLYFQFELKNVTNISYDIDMLSFFIRDKKQVRRTASQEIPIVPLYTFGNKENIKSHTSQVLVVALPKFTIPDKKWLYVQVRERNGGRHLEMKVGNRKIVKATIL